MIVLLRLVAKVHDDRSHHAQTKRNQLRRTGVGGHFVENMLLRGVPAGAAKLFRPADTDPTFFIQRAMPTEKILALKATAFEHFSGDLGVEVIASKFTYLFFENLLLR